MQAEYHWPALGAKPHRLPIASPLEPSLQESESATRYVFKQVRLLAVQLFPYIYSGSVVLLVHAYIH